MPEGMRVSGTNNRVAGRDYNENNYLNIAKPCQKCEIRFVTAEHTVCNHCTNQQQLDQAKVFGLGLLAAVLIIGFNLHEWLVERGLVQHGLEGIRDSLLLSLVLVVLAGFAVLWIKLRWWDK